MHQLQYQQMSKIVTAPHPSLRQPTLEITTIDKKILQAIADLEKTLENKRNPRGVGLAAPQVDKRWQMFATQLGRNDQNHLDPNSIITYLNPRLIKKHGQLSLGPDSDNPDLEGCLSIPEIYGPVPRYLKIAIEFEVIKDGKLITDSATFTDFEARVIQHELDHLNGILFTDYLLEYDLPAYVVDDKTNKFVEFTQREILESF